MGLFNFFKTNQPDNNSTTVANGNGQPKNEIPIPEDVFIDKRDPQEQPPILLNNGEPKGIQAIYAFLLADYEQSGYSDALTNSDQSNKADGIKLIKLNLKIIMDREINNYEKKIKDYECDMKSRADAGFIDLVEKIKTEKEKATMDIEKIKEIETQMNQNTGMFERVLLSYERGFKKGLSALTQTNILK